MFKQDIEATQKVASLTDTNPALPKNATLRLRSEAGSTDRASSLLGNLTITHSPTKELGGGFRHVVRMNYRAQGSIPGASAYVVVVNNDSVLGEARAAQCFLALIAAMAQLSGTAVLTAAEVDDNGRTTTFKDLEGSPLPWEDVFNSTFPNEVLPRLLGRES